jgi:hypothetical protein
MSAKFEGRPPDYRLRVRIVGKPETKATVGSAWLNESGNISVKLNNFVVLNGNDNLQLTLFPKDNENDS